MKTRYFKMFSGMFDAMNLRGISKHPTLPIPSHRIMVPASLPKFIANLHVFFRERIPIVVLNLLIEAEIPAALSRYPETIFKPNRPLVR